MSGRRRPRLVPLASRHDRSAFSCGVEELDDYLHRRARRDRDRHVAAVFVLEWEDAGQIAGFYTLSALSVGLGELPAEVSRRLPRYPEVPATLIGRLAVDSRHRGRGYGELLLMDALRRILDSTVDVASVAAVVDAKDEGAAAFYRRYGFTTFPKRPGRLFLPVATIRRMFE